jgi:hypothetical protein
MMHDWASPPKKPARVAGIIFRFTLLYLILLAFGYHWGREPVVPLKVAAIIAAAVLAPSVALTIYWQIRLRRELAHKRGS